MFWLIAASSVLLAVLLGLALFFYQSGTVTLPLAPAQPTLLLVGPSNGGKTSLFQTLLKNKNNGHTYTSQRANSGTLTLESGQKVRLVDAPGHPKLFSGFKAYGATNICFVLDSSTVSKHASAVARDLLEVLTFARRSKIREVSILANKSDFFTAAPEEKLTEILENEMEQIRTQKGGIRMDSIEEKPIDEEEEWLQDLSGAFKLKDECTIYTGSVLKGDVSSCQEWIEAVFA